MRVRKPNLWTACGKQSHHSEVSLCAGASGNVSYDANADRTCIDRDCYGLFQLDVTNASLSVQENTKRVAGWDQTNRQLVWQEADDIISLVQVPHETCVTEPSGSSGADPGLIIVLIVAFVAAALMVVYVLRKCCDTDAGAKPPTKKERARQAARAARIKLEAATRPDDETATTTFLSHHKKGAGETAANLKKLFDKDLSDAMGKPESTNYLDVEHLAVIDPQNLIRAVRSTDVLVLLLSSAQLPCPVLSS